jgi:hypothetical protein
MVMEGGVFHPQVARPCHPIEDAWEVDGGRVSE